MQAQSTSPARRGRRALHRLGAVALALAALQTPAWALDYTWRANVSGVWDDPSMWTLLGVPGSGDSATLSDNSAVQVFVRDPRSVGLLTMNGSQLYSNSLFTVGELRMNAGTLGGPFANSPTGSTLVTGSTSLEGTRTLSIGYNHTLTLQGGATWSAGDGTINGRDTGSIINTAAATFTDLGTTSSNGSKLLMNGAGTFVNNGTYNRNGLGTTIAYGMNNTGTVNVNAGTLRFGNNGRSTGTINVASGARLFLDPSNSAATDGLIDGTVNNLGTVEVGRGSYTFAQGLVIGGVLSLVSDGTLVNNSTNTLASLTVGNSSGAVLTGSGKFTTANFNFNAGTLGGVAANAPASSTVVTGAASFDGTNGQSVGYNHTLTLQGTTTWTVGDGAVSGRNTSSIVNTADATFTDLGTATDNSSKLLMNGAGSFVNNGTYNRNGLGTTVAYGVNNVGTINVNAGTLRFGNNGRSTGTINVAAGARLFLDPANSSATDGLIDGTVNNLGTVEVGRGSYTFAQGLVIGGVLSLVSDGTLVNNSTNTLASLTVGNSSGAVLTGSGKFTTANFNFNAGTLGGVAANAPASSTVVTGAASFDGTNGQSVGYNHTLTLQGTTTWTVGDGAVSGRNTSSILNTADATFTDLGTASSNGSKLLMNGAGTFVNNGTYNRNGLGTTIAYGMNNTGTVNVNAGTLRFGNNGRSTGTINVASGARLLLDPSNSAATDGLISGTVNNLGTVEVGRGLYTFSSDLVIGGVLSLVSDGTLVNNSTNTLASLTVGNSSGATLSGAGRFTTANFNFNAGTLGGVTSTAAAGSTTVTGTASFNGAGTQALGYNHALTLLGTTTWTVGDGTVNGRDTGSIINTTAATFTDLGTASSNGSKLLMNGAGMFVNAGTYERNGLGTTIAYGMNNTGTVNVNAGTLRFGNNGRSTGTINVASGARLFLDPSNSAATDGLIDGTVNNLGTVEVGRGSYTFAQGLVIGGVLSLVSDGTLVNNSTNTLASLTVGNSSGAVLTGSGKFTTANFNFNAGTLGGVAANAPASSTVVTGTASFDGTNGQSVGYNHTLTLQGATAWTAGSGAVNARNTGVIVNAAGATFADQGATNATSYKTLMGSGGGSFANEGSYVRSGVGTTRAYGFANRGTLDIASGTFAAMQDFSNTGTVKLASGAVLAGQFANAGLITGTGTVQTGGTTLALVNNGTLDPGAGSATGTLTVDGRVTMNSSSVLHIDLGAAGLSDTLAVTNAALLGGELSLWGSDGMELTLGTTYTLASFSQRLSSSTFGSVSWHGLSAGNFTLEYTADSVLLRVTAVPEPATALLWLLGGVGVWASRRFARRVE